VAERSVGLEVLSGANAVAERAAQLVAEAARESVAERGRFIFALSGGRTPEAMLRALAAGRVPWEGVRVVQVDERVAPEVYAVSHWKLPRRSSQSVKFLHATDIVPPARRVSKS